MQEILQKTTAYTRLLSQREEGKHSAALRTYCIRQSKITPYSIYNCLIYSKRSQHQQMSIIKSTKMKLSEKHHFRLFIM